MSYFDILQPGILCYVALPLVAYACLLVTHRVLFHPLSRYPGPLLAKITGSYGEFYALGRRMHLAVYKDHQKYGPVMRYGPNKLIFNSTVALQEIYNNERLAKSHAYLVLSRARTFPNIFNAVDKGVHRSKRKLVGQILSERAIRRFEPTMAEQIDIFLGLLLSASQTRSPVDMTAACKRLANDIIGLLSFGYPLRTQTEETNRFMISAMTATNYRANVLMQFPELNGPVVNAVLRYLGRGMVQKWFGIVSHMVKTRLAEDEHARADLRSFLAEGRDVKAPDQQQLKEIFHSEGIFFFAAGSETTATGVAAVFFYLSRNPAAYNKVASEIRGAFESGADIHGGPQLSSCTYLRACIDEALRMSPPVAGTLWREIETGKDSEPLIIDGHVVPHGTEVGVSTYALHHNEKYFPDSFAFRPERWLESSEDAATLKKAHAAFMPFSVGSRACLGKSLAYLEQNLAVAKTLWYFDFEKAPGELGEVGGGVPGKTDGRGRKDEFQLYDIFGATHHGPYLVFKPRGELWREIKAV